MNNTKKKIKYRKLKIRKKSKVKKRGGMFRNKSPLLTDSENKTWSQQKYTLKTNDEIAAMTIDELKSEITKANAEIQRLTLTTPSKLK